MTAPGKGTLTWLHTYTPPEIGTGAPTPVTFILLGSRGGQDCFGSSATWNGFGSSMPSTTGCAPPFTEYRNRYIIGALGVIEEVAAQKPLSCRLPRKAYPTPPAPVRAMVVLPVASMSESMRM